MINLYFFNDGSPTSYAFVECCVGMCYNGGMGNQRARAVCPLLSEGLTLQISCPAGTKERRDCQCMLHTLNWFRLEYSFAPLLECVILSSRERNSRHYCNSDGCWYITVYAKGKVASLAFPFLYHNTSQEIFQEIFCKEQKCYFRSLLYPFLSFAQAQNVRKKFPWANLRTLKWRNGRCTMMGMCICRFLTEKPKFFVYTHSSCFIGNFRINRI